GLLDRRHRVVQLVDGGRGRCRVEPGLAHERLVVPEPLGRIDPRKRDELVLVRAVLEVGLVDAGAQLIVHRLVEWRERTGCGQRDGVVAGQLRDVGRVAALGTPDELLGDVAERDGFAFDLDVRVLGFEVRDDLLDGRLGRLLGRGPVGPGDGHRAACVAAVVVTATTAGREQDGAGQAHGTSAQPPARVSARLRRSLGVRRTYHVDLSSRTAVGWRLDLWC